MRPHPRIRKCFKWGGAAASTLCLALWIRSAAYWAIWTQAVPDEASRWTISIEAGMFSAGCFPNLPECIDRVLGWRVVRIPFGESFLWWSWRLNYEAWSPREGTEFSSFNIAFPIWFAAVISAAPSALAWRLDLIATRRARRGHCPKCNYDLSGLPLGTPCPECGKAASAPVSGT